MSTGPAPPKQANKPDEPAAAVATEEAEADWDQPGDEAQRQSAEARKKKKKRDAPGRSATGSGAAAPGSLPPGYVPPPVIGGGAARPAPPPTGLARPVETTRPPGTAGPPAQTTPGPVGGLAQPGALPMAGGAVGADSPNMLAPGTFAPDQHGDPAAAPPLPDQISGQRAPGEPATIPDSAPGVAATAPGAPVLPSGGPGTIAAPAVRPASSPSTDSGLSHYDPAALDDGLLDPARYFGRGNGRRRAPRPGSFPQMPDYQPFSEGAAMDAYNDLVNQMRLLGGNVNDLEDQFHSLLQKYADQHHDLKSQLADLDQHTTQALDHVENANLPPPETQQRRYDILDNARKQLIDILDQAGQLGNNGAGDINKDFKNQLGVGNSRPSQDGSNPVLEKLMRGLGLQESSNRYGLVQSGTHALGKYQILPNNVREWGREMGLGNVSPQEFLANPKLQEDMVHFKLNQYIQKYGPAGAAAAWYGGDGGARAYLHNNPRIYSAQAGGMPSINSYVSSVIQKAGLPS